MFYKSEKEDLGEPLQGGSGVPDKNNFDICEIVNFMSIVCECKKKGLKTIERKAQIEILEKIAQDAEEIKKQFLKYDDPVKSMLMHYFWRIYQPIGDRLISLKSWEVSDGE
jgi:hypothetical protein